MDTEEFLGREAELMWGKYKSEYNATSNVDNDLQLNFYWTSLMGIKTNFSLRVPTPYHGALQEIKKLREKRKKQGLPPLKGTIYDKFAYTVDEHRGGVGADPNVSSFANATFRSQNYSKLMNESEKIMLGGRTFESKPLERLEYLSKLTKEELPSIIFLGE